MYGFNSGRIHLYMYVVAVLPIVASVCVCVGSGNTEKDKSEVLAWGVRLEPMIVLPSAFTC